MYVKSKGSGCDSGQCLSKMGAYDHRIYVDFIVMLYFNYSACHIGGKEDFFC